MNPFNVKGILLLTSFVLMPVALPAAEKDSNKSDSQIFLNAASDSQPREISLGLPTNVLSAVPIFEDGMPVSYYMYQCFPYKAWHGGVSASQTGTLNPMGSGMRYGEINYFVDSYNRRGSDGFRGALTYDIGQHGQHKADLNISGSLGKGWGYSASMYQNFDPGSNHLDLSYFQNRHQFYKGVLSKELAGGRGHLWGTYQYVNFYNLVDNFSPFVFNGDGTVNELEGFRLGIDQYLPSDPIFTIMDMRTGQMITKRYQDNNQDEVHTSTVCLDYNLSNGMHLDVRSRYKHATTLRSGRTLGGIDNVDASKGYTYDNGNAYEGRVQRRVLSFVDGFETSWMNNAELSGHRGEHDLWLLGVDYHWNHNGVLASSANTAHEAKANPRQLYLNGDAYYNYNLSSEYYDGIENKLALYGRYEWRPMQGLDLAAFVRAEYVNAQIESANNIGDSKVNTRTAGFNLTKATLTNFDNNNLNGAAGANLAYKFWGGMGLLSEFIVTRLHSTPFNYGGYAPGVEEPSDSKLFRAGLSYENSWLNLVSQVVYITQNNKSSRTVFYHTLENDVPGYPKGYVEAVTKPVLYGIESWGWTTDAMISAGKYFTLHLSCTLRDPKYKDFIFEPTFSDGVTEHYDFSGRNVTVLHKTELNIDPTFNYGPWRVWLTARYISKQYINKTNSLYFAGRWETFSGIDYKLNKICKLHVNFINLLNQKGASGTIASADLVEDASSYNNYVMSGTYIRPFTIETGLRIDF